jgi:tetratricopeptide (TPR) repeat protein
MHLGVADALVNLAEQCLARSEFPRAEGAFRRAVSIRATALGPDHIDVARIYARLGLALTAQRKYAEARELFVAALPIQERVLGPEAPEFALSLENYGRLLRQMNDAPHAEVVEARARSIRDTLSFTVSIDQLKR